MQKVTTIPNGCTMVERAYKYVGPDGTYYFVYTPSPSGVDGPSLSYQADEADELCVVDPSGTPQQLS